MTFNFFNCEKTKVIIEGKCKNVMFSKCKNLEIHIEETMSMTELLKCEAIKFYVTKKIPTISIEHCNGV
jgi:hypothetical protein